ncbi:MAG: 30S ribosome-binding factor RbfA [Alphaproteobacteria bacterium]
MSRRAQGGRGAAGGRGPQESHGLQRPRSPQRPRSQRQLRVGEEIRHLLARVFDRGELADPEVRDKSITVTEVRVSPDLRRATAYVSQLGVGGGAASDTLMAALKRSAPAIRHLIGRGLTLRNVPEVVFQADTVLDEAQHIETLLRSPRVRRDLTAAPAVTDGDGAEPGEGDGEEGGDGAAEDAEPPTGS